MIGQKGIPAQHGGVERAVEELAAVLVEHGHEVTVFNRRERRGEQPREHRGIRLIPVRATRGKYSGNLTQSLAGTMRALGNRYDVVHFHAMGPCLWAPLARFGGTAAVVATIQGRDDQRAKWGLVARFSLRAAAWTSARVPNEVIVVSEQLASAYADEFQRSTHHIPNGVTPVTVEDGASDVLERFDLAGRQYILNVGRLVPEKAMDQAIEAFRLIDTDARLVIVGGSSHTTAFAERLTELAAQDERVILTGPVYGDDSRALFASAAAYLMPSLLEGLPLALLEASSCGLPLIVSDIQPHLEVVGTDGVGRRVFATGDVQDMARAIRQTLDELPCSAAACRTFQQHVTEEYSWERIASLTESVYRQAIAHAAGGVQQSDPSLLSLD